MLKKITFILITYSLISTFASCFDSHSSNTQNTNLSINQDSINAFRKSINADLKAALIDSIFKSKAKQQGFNGTVLVAQKGQILYKNAFGFENFETKDSLQTSSAFQLASVSKTLTAVGILLLKDQEKIQLNDDVKKYFSEFPYNGITIKNLLSHRSGLPNYIYACEQYCEKSNTYNGKVFDNKAMLELLIEKKPAAYALPDKKFEYSNTNYAILALIIEKASGMTYADFMNENVFQPLKMNNTWVHSVKYDKLHQHQTKGYKANGKPEDEIFADDVVGDKSIYSTVEDMYKFDQALNSDKLLKKETKLEAYAGYSNEHKGTRNYGFGWRTIDDKKNPKVIYHNGWWHCYNTLFYRIPEKEITIIVLSNKYNKGVYHISDVLSILSSKEDKSHDSEEESL